MSYTRYRKVSCPTGFPGAKPGILRMRLLEDNLPEKMLNGDIGEGYIHVHHLVPLAEVEDGYDVDPVEDLRPVCPNCHAIIHRHEPPVALEDLSALFVPEDD